MERTITIKYSWYCDKFKKGIPKELTEDLEQRAEYRVWSMTKQGYVEGELLEYVITDVPGKKTPKEGWECRGYWSFKKNS